MEYPVWWWHWGVPADAPWAAIRRLDLSDAARGRKHRAIAAHSSQVLPLSEQVGDEVMLHPGFLAHFHGSVEVYVVQDGEDTALDDLHRAEPDPWGVDERWYEQRKRDLTLAMLPRRDLRPRPRGRVLDRRAGRAPGRTLRGPARRRQQPGRRRARPAIGSATSSTSGSSSSRCRTSGRPVDLDLVVVSEMAYFLSPRELRGLVDRVRQSLTPDGVVVLCHWQHRIDGWVLNGEQVRHAFADDGRLTVQATYRDRDVEIVLLGTADVLPEPTA